MKLKFVGAAILSIFVAGSAWSSECPSAEQVREKFSDLRKEQEVVVGDMIWRITDQSHDLPKKWQVLSKSKFKRVATASEPGKSIDGSIRCKYTYEASGIKKALGRDAERWLVIQIVKKK